MNSKLNDKLNQVTENTLIVGMDFAKRTHYACFVDERGRVLEKAFAVHQSKEGFEAFYQNILNAMKVFDIDYKANEAENIITYISNTIELGILSFNAEMSIKVRKGEAAY